MRWILALTALTISISTAIGLHGALRSVGQPFPGFLLLGNSVVASAGLSEWPATRDGEIYQHEIVAVDGVPITSAGAIHAHVRAVPVGTPVRYSLRGPNGPVEREIATRHFGWRDFGLLYGAYLLNGLLLAGAAITVMWRRDQPHALTSAPLLAVASVWALTAMDLYGPWRLFRLHALSESLLFAAALHMALAFPRPLAVMRRNPDLVYLPYASAAVLAVLYQAGLHWPSMYVALHLLALCLLGLALAALIASQIGRMLQSSALEIRGPIRVLAFGSLLALAPAVVVSIAEPFTGGTSPQNVMAFSAFLFPISIAWAVVRGGAASP